MSKVKNMNVVITDEDHIYINNILLLFLNIVCEKSAK